MSVVTDMIGSTVDRFVCLKGLESENETRHQQMTNSCLLNIVSPVLLTFSPVPKFRKVDKY